MRSAFTKVLVVTASLLIVIFAASAHADTATGSLFVANGGNGTIERFPLGGCPVPCSSGFVTDLFGLAFDSAGSLYAGTNSAIYKIAANGSTTTFATTGLNLPRGMAFDGAGNLFVANSGNNTIEKY